MDTLYYELDGDDYYYNFTLSINKLKLVHC